jgi:predicted acyltransferase (DUF342 family)
MRLCFKNQSFFDVLNVRDLYVSGEQVNLGALTVYGDITGNLFGDTTGVHFGNVYGNVFGDLTGNVYAQNSRIYLADGSESEPSITFYSDINRDTGIYWGGESNVTITNNGLYSGHFGRGGNFFLRSNITAGGELVVAGNARIGANITVTGNANIVANTTVGGNVTINGNASIDNNLLVSKTANISVDANIGRILSVTGNLYALKDEVVSGNLYVRTNEYIDGDLFVKGKTKLSSVELSGSIKLDGDLDVTGSATIKGPRGLILTNDLEVNGTGRILGPLGLVVSGDIKAGGDVIAYSPSDRNLKINVKPIENALSKLRKITGVMFDWTDEELSRRNLGSDQIVQTRDTGVIAQDVESVLPEVVALRKDGFKAVRYEKLAGLIIQAINELADEVDQLKNSK